MQQKKQRARSQNNQQQKSLLSFATSKGLVINSIQPVTNLTSKFRLTLSLERTHTN